MYVYYLVQRFPSKSTGSPDFYNLQWAPVDFPGSKYVTRSITKLSTEKLMKRIRLS